MNRYFTPGQEMTDNLRMTLNTHPYSSLVFRTPDGKRWAVSGLVVAMSGTCDLGTILCTLETSWAA